MPTPGAGNPPPYKLRSLVVDDSVIHVQQQPCAVYVAEQGGAAGVNDLLRQRDAQFVFEPDHIAG